MRFVFVPWLSKVACGFFGSDLQDRLLWFCCSSFVSICAIISWFQLAYATLDPVQKNQPWNCSNYCGTTVTQRSLQAWVSDSHIPAVVLFDSAILRLFDSSLVFGFAFFGRLIRMSTNFADSDLVNWLWLGFALCICILYMPYSCGVAGQLLDMCPRSTQETQNFCVPVNYSVFQSALTSVRSHNSNWLAISVTCVRSFSHSNSIYFELFKQLCLLFVSRSPLCPHISIYIVYICIYRYRIEQRSFDSKFLLKYWLVIMAICIVKSGAGLTYIHN